MRSKWVHKPRSPMRDNSKSISVRMTEEQYQRLLQYLPLTRLHSTTYFRKLIAEVRLVCRPPKGDINPRPASNKIYSNILQITRNPRARAMDEVCVEKLKYLEECCLEQMYLLTHMK